MRVLLTGAAGFLGSGLQKLLVKAEYFVRSVCRDPKQIDMQSQSVELIVIGNIDKSTDWLDALYEIDVVIHLAARVHVMHDASNDPLHDFRYVNVEGTLRLARQAIEANVKRFIYLSTIKVNGEVSSDRPFTENDIAKPNDAYAVSKWEAEEGLRHLADRSGLEVVIIRPPLIYGPGVKANFLSMMKWLYKGIPLPLGAIHNKRSLVALDNLVDLIVACVEHPAAANQTFLVSDGEDLSTTELLQRMGAALGKPARLFPVPAGFLRAAAMLLGKRGIAQRLLGSLQVDISKTREMLGWTPPVSVDEGLKRTAQWYLQNQNKV